MSPEIEEKVESWLSSLFVAVFFTIMGLLLVYFAGQKTTLTCNRSDGTLYCQLNASILNRYMVRQTTLPGLSSAFVEESCDDDCTYRVILVTDKGNIPLTESLDSDRVRKEQSASTINSFLSNPSAPSLLLTEGAGLWPYAGLVLLVIGIATGLRLGMKVLRSTFK